ncbi:MAG: transglycosylase SLT domain-containing protein [Luminiphilus sp.]|nr:transglycosylase SLT domain-containing protein [Luminiphilus sp.]
MSSAPDDVDNVCEIFREKSGWYKDAKKSRARWDVPISVMMAIMHQESRFVATAKPPRKKIWGVIPGPRPSDAYGYSQAKDDTWKWYERSSGNYGADRDDFGDAIDFIGWYNDMSFRQNRIAKDDTFRLYLAYHEGHGGYERKTYRDKQWLVDVARKVDRRAQSYNAQLRSCVDELEDDGWWPF